MYIVCSDMCLERSVGGEAWGRSWRCGGGDEEVIVLCSLLVSRTWGY